MSTLKHKGFEGSVTFEDGTLIIQILHIDDIITAQCDTAGQVAGVFQELVDDYIETCRELGYEPRRPSGTNFGVPLRHDLAEKAAVPSRFMP